ncbi:MAG: DUF481 domain-containing protein, partial [Phycisphaeraceae bacterium]
MLTFRKNKLTQAACVLALAGVAHQVDADDVELINGDVLTGTVVQSDERGIILKHPVLGTIPLQADRIAMVTLTKDQQPKADKPKPKKPAAKTSKGSSAKTQNAKAAKTDTLKKEALKAAAENRSLWQHFREDWTSRLTLGINGSNGPTQQQDYRIKFKTGFEDKADRYRFDTSWFYATANGDKTQNQFQANFTRDWLQEDKPWFFFIKGQYRFDDNRSWENRTSAFGGGGYTLKKTEDVEVNTRLGFGGTYEYGSVNEFTPEALFGGSVVKWHISDRAAISGETIYYPSLVDTAQFRVESSLE